MNIKDSILAEELGWAVVAPEALDDSSFADYYTMPMEMVGVEGSFLAGAVAGDQPTFAVLEAFGGLVSVEHLGRVKVSEVIAVDLRGCVKVGVEDLLNWFLLVTGGSESGGDEPN